MNGKRIIVTRAIHQTGELSTLLQQRGAEVLLYPCIAIVPPVEIRALDDALTAMIEGTVDWLVVTSANTVFILAQRLKERKISAQQFSHISIAVVGSATAKAFQQLLALPVQLIPDTYEAKALVTNLRPYLPARVLVLQADIAQPVLVKELIEAGATVTSVISYRTVPGSGGVNLAQLIAKDELDAITFTSPSTVHNCFKRLQSEGGDTADLAPICIACIGPVTAQTVQQLGLTVSIMPQQHTAEGLVDALERYFCERKVLQQKILHQVTRKGSIDI